MGFSLKAAWNYKCPQCRQGDMFIKPFDIKKPLAMPETCQYCDQKTEPEVGFYFGALMISYGISAWLFLGIVLTLVFYFDWSVERAMVVVIIFAILTYFRLLRFSRSLWLHFNSKYSPEIAKRVKQQIAENKAKPKPLTAKQS